MRAPFTPGYKTFFAVLGGQTSRVGGRESGGLGVFASSFNGFRGQGGLGGHLQVTRMRARAGGLYWAFGKTFEIYTNLGITSQTSQTSQNGVQVFGFNGKNYPVKCSNVLPNGRSDLPKHYGKTTGGIF